MGKKITLIIVSFVVLAALVIGVILFLTDIGLADDYRQAYVICQPGDFVNVRYRPSSRSEVVGRYETGDIVLLDGKEKDGFSHIVNTGLESGDAWICTAYLVNEKPELVNQLAIVTSRGRLAARKNVDGKRRCWLKQGDEIFVFWWTIEWCVTNKGFVKSEFIELEGT